MCASQQAVKEEGCLKKETVAPMRDHLCMSSEERERADMEKMQMIYQFLTIDLFG